MRQKCVSPFSSDPRIRVPPSQGPPSPRLLTASKSLVAERSRTLVPTVMPGTNLTEEAEGQGQTDRQRPREGSEEVSRERPDLPGPLGVSVPRPEEPVPCSRPGFRMSPKQTWPRAGWERAPGLPEYPLGPRHWPGRFAWHVLFKPQDALRGRRSHPHFTGEESEPLREIQELVSTAPTSGCSLTLKLCPTLLKPVTLALIYKADAPDPAE